MLSHGALEPDIFIPVWLQKKCMLKGNPFPETNRCENKPKVIRSFQKKSSFPTGISLITCWTNVGKMKWAKHHEFKFQFKDEELLLAKPSLPRIEQKPTLSEQWWEQCVDTYNGCVHSISLFYMCHFGWVRWIYSCFQDFAPNSRYSDFQWSMNVWNGRRFHILCNNFWHCWVLLLNIFSEREMMYVTQFAVFTLEEIRVLAKGSTCNSGGRCFSCCRHANKIYGNKVQWKSQGRKPRVNDERAQCAVSRTIKIVSYRIITSVHIKNRIKRSDCMRNEQLTHFPRCFSFFYVQFSPFFPLRQSTG